MIRSEPAFRPSEDRSIRRLLGSGFVFAFVLLLPEGGAAQELPATGAEQASWNRSTTHLEVTEFLDEIQERSDRILVRTIGRTVQDRPLPVAFLGAPPRPDPADSSEAEKPTILILGSVHGDEPSGREGALQLIRALTLGEDQELLERVDVIVVPNANPDGGTAGTRLNADGYDLNRDWVMAESPEVGAILDEVLTRFWPEVFLDVHNGGAFPYHLTYQATLDPAADPALVEFSRGPIFDHVREHLESREMSMYWYSGPSFDDDRNLWYWRTTEPWPRKQHSYGGLQDMITILFEIPERHSLEVAAASAREGMLGLVRFVADHPERVGTVVSEARRRTVESPLEEVHLELEATAYPGEDRFLVVRSGAADPGGSPPADDGVQRVEGENRTRYVPARSRPAPWGYVLDPGLGEVVGLLRRHGVRVEELADTVSVAVERFHVVEARRSDEPYQNRDMLDVAVRLHVDTMTLVRGSYLVRVGQPGGRLIPQLLEPDAVDSVVRWNLLDAFLPALGTSDAFLPIYRLISPTEIPVLPPA